MTDDLLSPERCAAIRSRLDEYEQSDYALDAAPLMTDLRDLLAAYDQITLERDKGERVFQAVVYAFEGKDVPEDLLTHGMVSRAMKHREAAEAALVVLTQQRDELHERCRAISYVSHDQADLLAASHRREQHVKALLAKWRAEAADEHRVSFCADELEKALGLLGSTVPEDAPRWTATPKGQGMNAKHTPGPWTVRKGICRNDHPDTSADVHGAHGEFVADCGCHDWANANARLIAAAPDLLDLLRRIVVRDGLNDNQWFWLYDCKELLAQIDCVDGAAEPSKPSGFSESNNLGALAGDGGITT